MKKIISILLLVSLALTVSAQENISFENSNIPAYSVYDKWEESPFNTGRLKGQIQVTENPYIDNETNSTEKVLAFNRSRFGSHLFGAKVELSAPLHLSPTNPSYLHVMVHSPHKGKITLLALGKRSGWNNQSTETFQIARTSIQAISAGQWTDAVFKLTGNEEAEVHSIVLIPDNKSMTRNDSDYIVYFDEIIINSNETPRFLTESQIQETRHEITIPETVNISFNSRMCNITSINGSPLPDEIPYGKDFVFNVKMDSDYIITGIKIKHGFNLSGEQYINKQQQWREDTINLSKDGKITIPAEYIDGDVMVEVLFTNRPI